MMRKRWLFILVLLSLVAVFIIASYNRLVKKEEKMKQDWSEVQNTYQRRLDLVPNLVNVVKGISDFENTILVRIAEARSRANSLQDKENMDSRNYEQQKMEQDSLAVNVNRLIAVIEAYPDLKGTDAYLALQRQLEGTERRIRVARRDFNESVYEYNRAVRRFPVNIVAGILGFHERKGFSADTQGESPVEINFNK